MKKLIPIQECSWKEWQTPRWKTAISRRKEGDLEQYSLPVAVAIQHGIIDPHHSLLDYGCGRGGDLRRLQYEGFQADGFDPYWNPRNFVNGTEDAALIYVLNVIENSQERDELLQTVFGLCDRHLLVAVRIDNRNPREEITQKQTFQKYYSDDEMEMLLNATLGQLARIRRLKSGIFVACHRPRLYAIPNSNNGMLIKPAPAKPNDQQLSFNLRLVA